MPRLHSEVCDRHLPRTGTDFRLLRKSASRSTDGRRLPIRQPGGERAETAVSRLDHSAVDNRSSRHHGRRRYPSGGLRNGCISRPADTLAHYPGDEAQRPPRASRAADTDSGLAGTARNDFRIRRASDQAGPDGFRLKHDAKSLGELSRDKPGKRARRNLIPVRKPPKIRKS